MSDNKVKPLRWTPEGSASTPFGQYLVVREDWNDDEDFWFVCFQGKPCAKCGEHATESAAKDAAWEDYQQRVLSAIERSGD